VLCRCVILADYVHNWDPVIFSLTDTIKLRWYGFSYLMAFIVGFLLLKWMGNRKLWVLPGEKSADFISAAAFFGVFLGGRLGYLLFYTIPEKGVGVIADDPLMILRVWEGGMASHGGILGLMIFTFFYARMQKVSWTGLGDGLCVVAPLGLMFGRLANFINGELYGRVATGFGGAMKFPDSLGADTLAKAGGDEHSQRLILDGFFRKATSIDPSLANKPLGIVKEKARSNPELMELFAEYLQPRYPSQLYQAAGEGLLLFLILIIVRLKWPKLPHGILTGLFFIFYAIFRITMEGFREPDAKTFEFGATEVTKGQFYSYFMIAIGIGFIIYAKMRKPQQEAVEETKAKKAKKAKKK